MRTHLALLALVTMTSLTGCPPELDPVIESLYRRGDEQILVCVNGAYTATVGAATTEGLWSYASVDTTTSVVGIDGPTGASAFVLTQRDDLSWGSSELGEGWTKHGIESAERDALAVRCGVLESRTWWH